MDNRWIFKGRPVNMRVEYEWARAVFGLEEMV
jgi:hypothetical protein